MHNRGQVIFFTLMLSITFFIIGYAIIAPVLNVIVNSARTQIGCPASDTYLNITCSVLDLMKPYVVGVILGLAGALIGSQVVK